MWELYHVYQFNVWKTIKNSWTICGSLSSLPNIGEIVFDGKISLKSLFTSLIAPEPTRKTLIARTQPNQDLKTGKDAQRISVNIIICLCVLSLRGQLTICTGNFPVENIMEFAHYCVPLSAWELQKVSHVIMYLNWQKLDLQVQITGKRQLWLAVVNYGRQK